MSVVLRSLGEGKVKWAFDVPLSALAENAAPIPEEYGSQGIWIKSDLAEDIDDVSESEDEVDHPPEPVVDGENDEEADTDEDSDEEIVAPASRGMFSALVSGEGDAPGDDYNEEEDEDPVDAISKAG